MTKRPEENPGNDPQQDRAALEQQLAHLREYRDWAVKSLGNMPAERPGSGVNLAPIRQKLREIADTASESVEWLSASLDGMPGKTTVTAGDRPHDLRYVNMSIIEAMCLFFEESGRAHTEEDIIREMESGGAIIGRKRHVGEIKKSIDANIRNGKLKKVRDKIGLEDWAQEKFR